jgi:putative FmdB family regulatory protein
MPVYEYRCTAHDHTFEMFQTVGSPAPACPTCGSPSRKVYTSVGLIFKGSGFHTTDYRRAGSPDGKGGTGNGAGGGEGAKSGSEGGGAKEPGGSAKEPGSSAKEAGSSAKAPQTAAT